MSYRYYIRFKDNEEYSGYRFPIPAAYGFAQISYIFRGLLSNLDEKYPDQISDFYYCNGSGIRFYLRKRK